MNANNAELQQKDVLSLFGFDEYKKKLATIVSEII
jgi:hypothetical protein